MQSDCGFLDGLDISEPMTEALKGALGTLFLGSMLGMPQPRTPIAPLVDWIVNTSGLPRTQVDNFIRSRHNDPEVYRAANGDMASRCVLMKQIALALGIHAFENAYSVPEIMDVARVNASRPMDEAGHTRKKPVLETTAVNGKYLYHRSNPVFRDAIKAEGLKPMVGESYELWWEDEYPGKKPEPAIFMHDNTGLYDPGHDDDLIRIDVSMLDLSHLKPDPTLPDSCYMYDLPIPPEALTFMYEGTGNDTCFEDNEDGAVGIKLESQSLLETVCYRKGHKNSKGESAPWVIVSCQNGKILSSHKTKEKAEEHLRQMEYYKHKK